MLYFPALSLFLGALLLVSSCGFQLRGAVEISQDVSPIYVEANSVFELAREVKSLLASNKIAIADNQNSANAQLTLTNEVKSRRVLSVDTNGRAREYLLSYTVNFSVKIKQEKVKAETITLTRSLLFDTDAVIAVQNESELLYKDMRRNVSRLILLKLQAHSLNHSKQSATKNGAVSSPSDIDKK